MALSSKPVLRQTQSLTMTPQMQQSLKVLQMSRAELEDFVRTELEANPLLQRASASPSTGVTSGSSGASAHDIALERFGTMQHSLQDHVAEQINLSFRNPQDRKIAEELAITLDEAGYLHTDPERLAKQLKLTTEQVTDILHQCQAFEPAGLFARDLAECLRLQLQADDKLTTAMAQLLTHLDLVAKRDFKQLKKLCLVDDEKLAEMLLELRRLNPKPGLAFDNAPVLSTIPDILVSKAETGQWHVTLNAEALPRVLVNEDYSRKLSQTSASKQEKDFLRDCRQKAGWLTRILDQRARTILNVASEIVLQQSDFFDHGAVALKPMTMQMVADAIEMHESTISRVAGQKYMLTPSGLYELRYFFNAAIKGKDNHGDFASEAVRAKIKMLIAQETLQTVLSDEALVQRLSADGIDIARRTVAKYREELGIPSSAKRRREKRLHAGKARADKPA